MAGKAGDGFYAGSGVRSGGGGDKDDNEPALVKVVEGVGRLRAAKGGRGMVVESSPVHSSKSNGYIERSVFNTFKLIYLKFAREAV